MIRSTSRQRDRRRLRASRSRRRAWPRRCCRRSCGPSGGGRGWPRPRSTDRTSDVGGGLDLLALVEVLGLLVAGEVDDAVAELPGLLADREEDGVAEAAAAEHHGRVSRAARWRVPVGPMTTTGSPGFRTEQRRVEPPISRAIIESRPFSLSTQAPVSAQRLDAAAASRSSRGAATSRFWRRKNWPGWKLRAAAGARTTTSTIVGVSRLTRDDAGRQVVLEPRAEGVPRRRRRGRAAPRAGEDLGDRDVAVLAPTPSP